MAGTALLVLFPMMSSGENLTAPDAMPDDQFWQLIDLIEGTGWTGEETNLSPLVAALSARTGKEIGGFFEALAQKLYALDTRAHYGSFSWFPGKSDTFLYTRLAVVAQGRDEYRRILNDPRLFPASSARWLEGLLYVADVAYLRVTGSVFERASSVNFESGSNDVGWQ